MTIPFLDNVDSSDFLDFLDNLLLDSVLLDEPFILDEQLEESIKEYQNEQATTAD